MCAKTGLERKIHQDIQTEILNYYDRMGISYKADESAPESTIVDFFSYLYKMIPDRKRKVEYSNELKIKMDNGELPREQVDILKKYEDAFKEGKNMNDFLSNKTGGPDKIDFLLYTWHLYHLHLSGKFDAKMKNNRSDTLLLCIVNNECVYFVDVIPHPKKAKDYFKLRYLEIIKNNNWMEYIDFFEIPNMEPGSLEPKITSEEDIFLLYSKGAMNISFEFEGKGYSSLLLMTSTRNPEYAVKQLQKINREIRCLNNPEEDYKGFRFAISKEGYLMGIVKFENSKHEVLQYNIF